ncbi:hypothetical protein [Aneurinibacillus migulanus]|uniref:Uncharacterized protein n=1 Tax=Aneurinibacillus migulanus TaxID=47500 RepID=A0A0M0H1N5_ANEMI|nr:hypothetical protein [Aneurinibacillus migulanus]KON95978.1 hypothetical protein AF333_11245 [Aneurinibacillus migulanus]MED0896538.1 hypothetical protein [Aneurinibacillus migulanus]MED1616521.1 hypothetical protein [Aneurinibacillus migulanus]MED4727387.1 hypothetical protein [Aneurinibacillus migulanus]SDJ18647.1 hypothetical protein SAMN04487909_11375 [Aneurinibacillus migulanus]
MIIYQLIQEKKRTLKSLLEVYFQNSRKLTDYVQQEYTSTPSQRFSTDSKLLAVVIGAGLVLPSQNDNTINDPDRI